MTIEKIKKMMDACYLAKRAWDMLPSLPQGVAPSYIHYLDIIEMLESRGVRRMPPVVGNRRARLSSV